MKPECVEPGRDLRVFAAVRPGRVEEQDQRDRLGLVVLETVKIPTDRDIVAGFQLDRDRIPSERKRRNRDSGAEQNADPRALQDEKLLRLGRVSESSIL